MVVKIVKEKDSYVIYHYNHTKDILGKRLKRIPTFINSENAREYCEKRLHLSIFNIFE